MYAPLAPASRPALRAPQLCWVPALTPAHSTWLRSVSRKTKNCSAQPLHGQDSVAHVFAHPLFGGHGKPSQFCVALQHTAIRHTPWQKPLYFFHPKRRFP
jgi:hypothetical protein